MIPIKQSASSGFTAINYAFIIKKTKIKKKKVNRKHHVSDNKR